MILEERLCINCIYYNDVQSKEGQRICPFHTSNVFINRCDHFYEKEIDD